MKLDITTIAMLILALVALPAHAQPDQTPLTADFTYQGQLRLSGTPVNATADFQFKLFGALAGGMQVGSTQSVNNVSIANGLFTVSLNFGAVAFNGDARWLEIAVRSPAGGGTFMTLTPRQPLTATPYALQTRGIFVDATNRVGIGTTSPAGPFEVASGMSSYLRVNTTFGDLHYNGGTDGAFGLYNDSGATGRTEFIGQGIPRLAVLNTGNVGIGTSVPNFPLSFGTALSHTKIALYETSLTNHYGMGVVAGQFSFHLNTAGARYAFYDSDELTNEIFTVFGNGVTRVKVLEITGADLSEKFPSSDEKVEPGTVMEIDPDNTGKLRIARGAYNPRVAGVVSGANNFSVGAILGNLPGHEDAPAIALSGRVYVRCDASSAPIQSGDLLTTSNTPGHAMKAADRERAQGAIIGKAMSSLTSDKGLVLVLVTLQ